MKNLHDKLLGALTAVLTVAVVDLMEDLVRDMVAFIADVGEQENKVLTSKIFSALLGAYQ